MKNDLFNLEKEVAVVLGGTGTLGGAMAEALASAGRAWRWPAAIEERGRERVRAIESAGGKAMFVSADAMDRDSLDAGARRRREAMGHGKRAGQRRRRQQAGGDDPTGRRFLQDAAGRVSGRLRPESGGRHAAAVPGLRRDDGRGPSRQRRQHRVDVGHPAAVARGVVLGVEGGGAEPDAVAGGRVGDEGRARQRHQPRLLPGRAEPGDVAQTGWHVYGTRLSRSSATRRWAVSARRTSWLGRSSGWRRRGRRGS